MARDQDEHLDERGGGSHKRRRSRSRSRSRDGHEPRPRADLRHEVNYSSRQPIEIRRYPPQPRPRYWFAKEYDPIQVGSIDGTDTTPHDKALVRAVNARFDASRDPKIVGDPYKTLFVGRLNYATTEDSLTEFFARFGKIERARIVRDVVTQQSKGYAFVEFERESDFARAYKDAHRLELDGRTILVDFERSRVMPGWKPRRLGGGLGGRKESGQLRFGGRDHPFKPPIVQAYKGNS